jgi:predicted AAA+ superfamily ATPase
VIDSPNPREDLNAYVGTYLKEEIQAEGLTRSIGAFSRFLEVAGLTNGEQVNFTAVASDSGVPARTVREHYQVLEDTLVGHQLPAFRRTKKRKPVATSKFYFFDVGVANALMKRGEIREGSDLYGRALEHQIFLELRSFLDYRGLDEELCYWRSHSQFEVDFVLGGRVGIEVKGKARVGPPDVKGLLALAEEVPLQRKIVVCRERVPRRMDEGVEVLPVEHFLQHLWDGGLSP